MKLLLNWILNALALLLISYLVPGFHVNGFIAALIAALVIGLLNMTIGALLKLLTFPLSIVTFGFFLLVINAFMLELASAFVPGFRIHGFWPALIGAILLAILQMIFVSDKKSR